jgi:hypothetical protein
MFTSGLAMFAAAAQVYFRDTQALMPFILRLTMFVSPVLYFPEQAKALFDGACLTTAQSNLLHGPDFFWIFNSGDTFDVWTWLIAFFGRYLVL